MSSSSDIDHSIFEALTKRVPKSGSYFPVVGNSVLDAHGRNTNMRVTVEGNVEVREYRANNDERPRLDVSNRQWLLDWFKENLGRPETCPGFFRRTGKLIRVPLISEEGYEPPPVGEDGLAQVKTMTREGVVNALHSRYWAYREKVKVVPDDTLPEGERIIISREGDLAPVDVCNLPVVSPDDFSVTLPEVSAVTHTPMLRKDGSILSEPGYDTESRTLYLPEPGFEILRHPELGGVDAEWVKWAADSLRYLVADFPFEHELHKLNYFALLFTPLMRWVVPPPYPMWLINAHQRGTGKSLLARIARVLHDGIHRPDLPTDGEEIRKQITSILTTTTAPIVNFDNVTAPIRSGQIANLLTTLEWQDRPLGSTANVKATNDRLWVATGNNIQIGGDMARRSLWVNIDAGMADPEFRTGFREKDLPAYAQQHRGTLITALLVLLMSWVQRGMPIKEVRSDDYGKWTGAISEVLEGAGLDPGGVFAGGERAVGGVVESVDEQEHGEMLELLEEMFGVHTEFMVKHVRQKSMEMGWAERIQESMPSRCQASRDPYKSLGNYMRDKTGTVVGTRRWIKVKDARGGIVYMIDVVESVGEAHITN